MTLEELIYKPTEVKVLDSTHLPDQHRREMIGKVYEAFFNPINQLWYLEHVKNNYLSFNKSDIQVMTPLEYKGERIGLGDEVRKYNAWYMVYGFSWHDGKYMLDTVENGDYVNGCCSGDNLEDHKPLHPSTPQVVEVSLEEIAQMKGIPVEQLRIKE